MVVVRDVLESGGVRIQLVLRTVEKARYGSNSRQTAVDSRQYFTIMDHYLTGEPLPLAISYYQLYSEIIDGAAVAAVTENQDDADGCCMIGVNLDSYEPQQHEQQQQLQHELTVSQSSYEPWVVDTEWDATREAVAEQELLDNVERCRLPPSSNWSEDRSSSLSQSGVGPSQQP